VSNKNYFAKQPTRLCLRRRCEHSPDAQVVSPFSASLQGFRNSGNRHTNNGIFAKKPPGGLQVFFRSGHIVAYLVMWHVPRSSWPICTPSQPTAKATSMRSFIRRGILCLWVIACSLRAVHTRVAWRVLSARFQIVEKSNDTMRL
jgi:hypothetical protein